MSGLYEELRTRIEQEQGIAVATVVSGPAYVGTKLLVYPDGTAHGTLDTPELVAKVVADAEPAIWSGKAATLTYQLEQSAQETKETESQQAYRIFIEGFPPPPELIIVGAGHIAIPLTTFAKTLNYRVVVIDARSAFATRERFPHADELIVAWPDEILEKRELYPSTSIAVLTHDPKFDEPTLKVILSRRVGYVGAIGSRQTSKERAERLKKQGLTDEQIKHIHGPIGLNLGGKAPEEIALAIMAEVVAVRNGK